MYIKSIDQSYLTVVHELEEAGSLLDAFTVEAEYEIDFIEEGCIALSKASPTASPYDETAEKIVRYFDSYVRKWMESPEGLNEAFRMLMHPTRRQLGAW